MRIAGVNVGKVKSVERQEGTDPARVTMEITRTGLPIHEDATAKIRPRIFLEGNFFVDLKPGSPGDADAHDGDTIKVTQTATPVQLDQLLTALQSAREDLRDVLESRPGAQHQADAQRRTRRRSRRARTDRAPRRSTTPTTTAGRR